LQLPWSCVHGLKALQFNLDFSLFELLLNMV